MQVVSRHSSSEELSLRRKKFGTSVRTAHMIRSDAGASMLTAHLFCDEQATATLGDVARKDWEASEPLVAGAVASVGTSTLSSQGIEGDQAMSLKERAEQGDLEAQYQFGMALKTGAGMPADHVRSRVLPVKTRSQRSGQCDSRSIMARARSTRSQRSGHLDAAEYYEIRSAGPVAALARQSSGARARQGKSGTWLARPSQ
jgi:hypothetical protein